MCEHIPVLGRPCEDRGPERVEDREDGVPDHSDGHPILHLVLGDDGRPEIYKDKAYDAKSDMWSLGCILYEMCCLRPPFIANSFKELRRNVLLGAYPPIPKFYSAELFEVVKLLLKLEPADRPTCSTNILSQTNCCKTITF